MNNKKLISIGRITKAHGVTGELVVDFYAENSKLLDGELFLSDPERAFSEKAFAEKNVANKDAASSAGKLKELGKPVKVTSLRWHHGKALVRLDIVKDRTEAELLRNCEFLIPESKLPALSDGEVYIHALIGLKVDIEDASGRRYLGVLEWVDQSGGQELWGIATDDDKEVLFPAVDEFIVKFDIDNGVVIINPPEGLLELYLSE